jgi:cytochrome c oxidase subunit III
MSITEAAPAPLVLPPKRRAPLVPSGVVGMSLFVFTEVMLFSGFISAFAIVRGAAPGGVWPPADQPRLPVEATAFNTAALLLSGVLLVTAFWLRKRRGPAAGGRLIAASVFLGALFVLLQGSEWVALIADGLTLTSSQMGGFFYVIVGAHALHAAGALVGLLFILAWHRKQRLTDSAFATAQLFWLFVVAMWPIIYWRLYL